MNAIFLIGFQSFTRGNQPNLVWLVAFLVFVDVFREKKGSLIQAAKIPGVAVIGT